MAKKLAVRYVVGIGGQLRRLFSIREAATTGDLLITTHVNGLGVIDEASQRLVKESRSSIHVSPSTPGNTVHGVTVYTDGSRDDRYLVTNALTRHAYDTIYARSVPNPYALPKLTLPAPKGDLMRFPSYDPRKCTMHYAIWFGSIDDAMKYQDLGIYSCIVSKFHHFAVVIPFGYSPHPSPVSAPILHFSTTTEEKQSAADKAANRRIGPSEGVTPEHLAKYVIGDFNRLITEPSLIGPIPEGKPPAIQPILFSPGPLD